MNMDDGEDYNESTEQDQIEKAKGRQEGANNGEGQQIPRPTAIGERARSMIGQGVDHARPGATQDQLAGVPVTTITMGLQKDHRDSSQSNSKAGRKFQPASQRSKSFIKTSGLAYGTNQASSSYMSTANDGGPEQKSRSPFTNKLMKAEPQSATNTQGYGTKPLPRSGTQGTGSQNPGLQNQYKTQQAQNTLQLSNNNINDSSFNNETLVEDQLSPTADLLSQSSNIFDSSNSQDNVKVVIRVRPLSDREQKGAGKAKCVQVENGTIVLDRGFDLKKFNFDFVGQENIEQSTMFNQIAKPIADSCIQGYNGTIFAYGQTGAGKTFTIQGPTISVEGVGDQMAIQNGTTDARSSRGIMQRSYEYIFQNIEAQKKLVEEKGDGSELSYLIKCSYLEIYNEQIMDLLEPSSINLHVREDIKKGVYVEGLQEEIIGSYRDMIQLIQKGGKNRHVGSTSMNRESSRSHSVLTTIIESKSMSHTGVWNMKTSRFHIIDLAGSERSKNTNTVGERLKEAGMINKSLSALGNVINSLVDLSEGKNRHVPYRDSKLTFILRDSLGGNSRTVIIANISPSSVNMGETLSTLEFARRAKQIKNRAIVNEDSSGTILVLKTEIKRLKKDLMEQGRHFSELIEQKKQWAEAEQVCKVCRTNMRLDRAEDREFDQRMMQEDGDPHEDSLLIDSLGENVCGDHGERESPKRVKHEQYLKDRLRQAENLLAANLENLSSQQKFYENQISQCKEEIQSLNQSVEALNGQVSRDNMKIKLREDKIQKLEHEHGISPDENVGLLQKEIKILQAQLEQEKNEVTNPKIAKLMAENKQLVVAKAQLEKELNHNVQSLGVQFASQADMIEKLNGYLKTKASVDAFEGLESKLHQAKQQQNTLQENEQKLNLALEELQQEYDILLTQNVLAEEQNQKLTREYGKAKVEIQTQNEQIDILQKSSKQRLQEIEQFASDMKHQADKLLNLESSLNQQNDLLDSKTQEAQKLSERILQLQDELTSKTEEIDEQESINETLHVQVEQENIQKNKLINELKEEQDRAKESKVRAEKEKEALKVEIQNLKEDMIKHQLDSECKMQCSHDQHELQITNAKEVHLQNMEMQKSQFNEQIAKESQVQNELKAKIIQLKSSNEEHLNKIAELKSQITKLNEDKAKELQSLTSQIESASSQTMSEVQSYRAQVDEKNFEIDTLTNEINDQKERLSNLSQELEFSTVENQNVKQELDNLTRELASQQSQIEALTSSGEQDNTNMKTLTSELESKEDEIGSLHSKIANLESEFESNLKHQHSEQKKELKKQMQEKTQDMQAQMDTVIAKVKAEKKQQLGDLAEQLLDLEGKLEVERADREKELTSYKDKVKELQERNSHQESNISYLDVSVIEMKADIGGKRDTIQDLKKKNDCLIEEINACKQLLSEKHQQTAGAEQETAESQVLLLEAQSLISQKMEELDEVLQEKLELELQRNQKDDEVKDLVNQVNQLTEELNHSSHQLDHQISQVNDMKQELAKKAENIQKYENENINLQFKRDEGTKNLEHKIKELKVENKRYASENESQANKIESQSEKIKGLEKDLQESLGGKDQQNQHLMNKLSDFQSMNEELVKEIEMLRVTQEEFIGQIEREKQTQRELMAAVEKQLKEAQSEKEQLLSSQMDEKSQSMLSKQEQTQRQTALLKEVSDMQVYIDELTESLKQATRTAKEIDKIKQDCYRKIEIIQNKNKSADEKQGTIDEEKTKIKKNISEVLAEISDVSLYSGLQSPGNPDMMSADSQKAIEINLLISQIVCEISKLYEKQIVLEKQKASQDFKRFNEKYEKQKGDIKQMQMYHANKVKDLTQENYKLKMQMEGTISDLSEQLKVQQKQLLEQQSDQNEENTDVIQRFEELNERLAAETTEKEQILQELERYKVYLPEAEGLLQEVNGRHQEAMEEIQQQQTIAAQYESEILDLNKALKNQKKMLNDQKQLYEVRVQSQEQEIDQHQFRYRELEQKMLEDIEQQEIKFAQVQEQVQILAQIKRQAKLDREGARKQMQEMQASVELVEQNDKVQRQEIKQLQQRIQQREGEMTEVVNSLKQFVEANRYLETENQRLSLELELMAGHKNPQQKIQLHLKIKEENNRLREDNLRLQDDLSKKIDIIQKHQKESRTQQLFESTMSPKEKTDGKSKKELDTLIMHVITQPQFSKLAKAHNMNLKTQGSHSVQKVLELLAMVDDALEAKDEQIQGLRKMPPKPQGHNLQNYISKTKRSEQQHGLNSTQKFRSPGVHETRNNTMSQAGLMPNPHGGSVGMLPPNQILMRAGSASGIKAPNQPEHQAAPIREQNRLTSGNRRPSLTNLQGTHQLQNKLTSGSPVMLNSYSSLYKQNASHRGSSRDKAQGYGPEDDTEQQMQPEKENTLHLMSNGYSDIIQKQKQYKQTQQVRSHRAGESKPHPSSNFNSQFQQLMSAQQQQYQKE